MELARVGTYPSLTEAELVKGVLLEQGIPSLIRRTAGFDVPDFLAAGPRDILVPSSGYEAAREMLRDADLLSKEPEPGSMPGIGSPARLAAGVLISVVLAAGFFYLVYLLSG